MNLFQDNNNDYLDKNNSNINKYNHCKDEQQYPICISEKLNVIYDKINCLQRSVANLRGDFRIILREELLRFFSNNSEGVEK